MLKEFSVTDSLFSEWIIFEYFSYGTKLLYSKMHIDKEKEAVVHLYKIQKYTIGEFIFNDTFSMVEFLFKYPICSPIWAFESILISHIIHFRSIFRNWNIQMSVFLKITKNIGTVCCITAFILRDYLCWIFILFFNVQRFGLFTRFCCFKAKYINFTDGLMLRYFSDIINIITINWV